MGTNIEDRHRIETIGRQRSSVIGELGQGRVCLYCVLGQIFCVIESDLWKSYLHTSIFVSTSVYILILWWLSMLSIMVNWLSVCLWNMEVTYNGI